MSAVTSVNGGNSDVILRGMGLPRDGLPRIESSGVLAATL